MLTLYQIHTLNNNLNEEGMVPSPLMCAHFFMIKMLTFMLQDFSNNIETLGKHLK